MEKTEICYCIRLRRAANAMTRVYNKALSGTGLTLAQYSLLKNIFKMGSCNKSQLAKKIGLERTTVIRDLARLSDAGLVREISGPSKRNNLVVLTNEGEDMLDRARYLWEQAQTLIRSRVNEEELNALLSKIQTLCELDPILKGKPDLFSGYN